MIIFLLHWVNYACLAGLRHFIITWAMASGIYSGMRLGEILQLQKTDVKFENEVWFFDISTGEGKSLKTASSKRRVPIHRTLLDLGLLHYIQSGEQSGRIFPEIKKGTDGYHSHHFSKWWGRYAGHAGFKTPKTAFHSFRHNFTDALRAAELPEYIKRNTNTGTGENNQEARDDIICR